MSTVEHRPRFSYPSSRTGPAVFLTALAILLPIGCAGESGAETAIPLLAAFGDARSTTSAAFELEPLQLESVRVGGEERPALLAHAPSRIVFSGIVLGERPRLEFAVGLADRMRTRLSDGARFAVAARVSGEEAREIWSLQIDPRSNPEQAAWQSIRVDLAEFAGRSVDLLLITEPGRGGPLGDGTAWAMPVVRFSGASPSAGGPPSRHVERDLLADLEDTTGCSLSLTVPVPEGGYLDLAGQILRDDQGPTGPLGPVRLAVRVAGDTLVDRQVTSNGSILTLAERVPLAPYAGETVPVEFTLCDEGEGNTLLWARRLWLGLEQTVAAAPIESGPNLLVLMVDTLRADRLGLHGYARETSPNLDRFAGDALVFDDAISSSSWTLPATASLLTGRSPLEHGVIEGVALGPRFETLGELLQHQGFATFGFSSNPIVGRLEGMHRGFGAFAQIPWTRAEAVNRIFLEWQSGVAGRRWFAYLHYIDPHSPYDAPAPWGGRFGGDCETRFAEPAALQALSESINFGRGDLEYRDTDIACLSDRYDDEILYWDAQLATLLQVLEARGVLANTIVAITSDHGEEFLEHGKLLHGYQLHDETVRVPLILRGPGVSVGRRAKTVETRALPAALLDLVGGPAIDPPPIPLLEAEAIEAPRAFSHTTEAYIPDVGYTSMAAVQDPNWKFTDRPADSSSELFDRVGDPTATRDLAGERPEVAAEYRLLLEAWLEGAAPRTLQMRGLDPESLEKLRALGYIR